MLRHELMLLRKIFGAPRASIAIVTARFIATRRAVVRAGGSLGRRRLPQLHFAPGMPAFSQSSDFMFGGGLTQSAAKRWMSSSTTIFFAAS